MNNWQSLSQVEQQQIIDNISFKSGLSPNAIEKDWWVTKILKALFQTSCAEYLVFKGGTSLSKGWGIIERFSEDIDLAIDRSFFGFQGDLHKKEITKLRKQSSKFIKEKLSVELGEILISENITDFDIEIPKSTVSDADPQEFFINYVSKLPSATHFPSQVKIEISCRSLRDPFEEVQICSAIGEYYPGEDFSDPLFPVNIVSPKLTFLEKAFLLHEEFQLERASSERMSRHLYDLEKLMDTEFGVLALNDTELYTTIVKHRFKFTKWQNVVYKKHHPSSIDFVPPVTVLKEWENDYTKLKESFIYGDSLSFVELINRIEELRNRFRKIILDDEFFKG